ncbi:DNA translocase FtsK [Aneurinibacillus sp. Ricciae_BoGa-3]|nr:DNA translocase FtsK [Aneurinibacillus sp. Ricciae_BoGa-3]WCK56830.1 DNA translocase FtsK [Aneurinibacillus sp. Ricciae_BoGa-3]
MIAISLLVLLTFSNATWFGRYFSWVFRIAAGSWDFLIPLFGVAIGLYVMVQRKWPALLSARWVGLGLLLFSILVWDHRLLFEQLTVNGKFAARSVVSVSWDLLLKEKMQINAGKPSTTDVGGGMIGAIGYGFFSYLAGNAGAMLIVIFMVLIGIMLAFQLSYVRMLSSMRVGLSKIGAGIAGMSQDALALLSEKREERLRAREEQSQQEAEADTESDAPSAALDSANDTNSEKAGFLKRFAKNGKREKVEKPIHSEEKIQASQQDMYHPHDEAGHGTELIIDDFTDNDPAIEEHTEEPLPMQMTSDGPRIKVTLQERKHTELKEPPAPVPEVSLQFEEQEESNYLLPRLALLDRPKMNKQNASNRSAQNNAHKLEATLESFGVQARVLRVQRGPTVTRYEVQPAVGVKVSKIVNLTDDIALALAARGIRIEAPIPGKSAIGIEVPNDEISLVTLREVLESEEYQHDDNRLSIALGRDISGQPIIGNLAKMPHLLVAGATGSGKSVCINGIIMSILFKAKPSEVKLMMIDPKMVELNVYNGIPHLLSPVVTDPRRASIALKKVLQEMERRYELFAKSGTRDLERYNHIMALQGQPALPLIVVIVDELADLMMVAPGDVEDAICRLAQMARAAGIHLIIATQRPSVDVITGVIKANIPSRIAFGVSSMADSRTILDMGGAEKLLGRGDMLYLPVGASKPTRVQGAFISDQEVENIVSYVKSQLEARYHPEMIPDEEAAAEPDHPDDELYDQAVQLVREAQTASVSLVQRRLRVGYTRAARLIDMMEARGIVGPYEGSKPREVLSPRTDTHIS